MTVPIQFKRMSPLVLMIALFAVAIAAPDKKDEPSSPAKETPLARTDRYGDPLPPGAIARLGTIRLRPCHEVYFLAVLPDGKRLLTIARKFEENTLASGDTGVCERKVVVCLWRMATGELLRRFELPIGDPVYAALSPNGKILVTAGSCASDFVSHVFLWDVDNGKKIGELPNPPPNPDQIIALSFAGDSKTLATTDGGSMFRLWDTEKRKELRRFKGGKNLWGHLSLSHDGKTLALVRDGLELWDTASGKQLHSYALRDTEGQAMAFSPDGKLLATTNRDKKLILLWDVASGKEIRRIRCELEIILVVAFSPDSNRLAAGGAWEDDKVVKPCPLLVWDVNTGREIRRLSGPLSYSTALAFSPDGKRVASCGFASILHIWDIESGKNLLPLPAHEHNVNSVAFSPDKQLMATAGTDGTIRLWERATSKPIRVIENTSRQSVHSVVFANEGKTLISCGKDGAIHYWDVKAGRETRKIVIDEFEGISFVCSPDGKTLAVFSLTGNLCLFDVATGKIRRHCKETTCAGFLCFSHDGTKFASTCMPLLGPQRVVQLLDTATGKRLHKWKFPRMIGPLVFSGDGRTLFMGDSYSHPFFVGKLDFHAWDTISGEDHPPAVDQLAWLCCMTLSPDGRMLAWGDTDGTITLWDIAAGQLRHRLKGHAGFVLSLTFSADGKTLASGSWDTSALLWDVFGRPDTANALPLTLARLQALWDDLVRKDAGKAFDAICLLTASPQQALPFLKAKLRPATSREQQQVARLIADLDADAFAVREKATEQLRQRGDRVESALRQALKDKPLPEARRRIEGLLQSIRTSSVSLQLRDLRAVEVLEHIGTAEARQVLRTLADGAEYARLTREAKASLERLDKRPSPKP